MDQEMTMDQITEYVGCTRAFISKEQKSGALKGHLKLGSKRLGWRFYKSDVSRWLAKRGETEKASRLLPSSRVGGRTE